jgi:Protein of unknown function (DUF3710)
VALRRERDRSRTHDDVAERIEAAADAAEEDAGATAPADAAEVDDAALSRLDRRSRARARANAQDVRPGRRGRRDKRTERDKLDATPPWETHRVVEVEETSGPYDVRDAPGDGIERVDLGALRIPTDGLELRVDVEETGTALSATLVHVGGQMQLGVFAAPRSEGIWDEVRAEIRASIGAQRGTVQEVQGVFGTELTGSLPGDGGVAKVRFVGVDGPRWFLRAMLVGAPATDPAQAKRFNRLLRNVVVVRGTEPQPVRDPIPLTLPEEIAAQLRGDPQP